MNNIELQQLKHDLKKYCKFSNTDLDNLHTINEVRLSKLKKHIMTIKSEEYQAIRKEQLKRKIFNIFREGIKPNPNIVISKRNNVSVKPKLPIKPQKPIVQKHIKPKKFEENKFEAVNIPKDRKPRILFICDVKGWAWWIKTEYLKKYLSDEFDIDIVHLIGNGSTPHSRIDQKKYDLYFTYGFSYIDFLTRVPKKKKITGVTAHRRRDVIFPKMKIALHHHANSIMLLKELKNMGFSRSFYVPNGVDEELFKPIKPIKKDGELIVGHVGKETPLKGQREFILPAIKTAGAKSVTNLRTWQDKLPHTEMPNIYQDMDVFVVASVEDGTPNPALEAAACGRPIISNHIGNMPELIKDGYNGFLVPRKIGAYVEKIRYFKENRDELVRMGNNARKTIEEEWTWRLQSERYRSMFRTIFGRI